jgi:hypothetical protein
MRPSFPSSRVGTHPGAAPGLCVVFNPHCTSWATLHHLVDLLRPAAALLVSHLLLETAELLDVLPMGVDLDAGEDTEAGVGQWAVGSGQSRNRSSARRRGFMVVGLRVGVVVVDDEGDGNMGWGWLA